MEDNTEQMKEYLKLKKLEDENKTNDLIDEIGVRIDIWTHFMRGCIIDYVH